MTDIHTGSFAAWSRELADLVERGAEGLVRVNARRRVPASGVLWAAGTVVTADHVLERDEDITVTLPSGQHVPATIAGRDPRSDLAVLRIDQGGGAPARLPSASIVKVGNLVLALGRAGETTSATFGMVSSVESASRGAPYGCVRAELTMLPGFSGGPLLDAAGGVVGINGSRLGGGAHLAIPTAGVQSVVDALLKSGKIKRAFLGLTSQQVPLPPTMAAKLGRQQESGLITMTIETGSPAEKAGLLPGDIVVALGGQPVRDAEELQEILGSDRVGVATSLTVLRGGEVQELSVTPAERA